MFASGKAEIINDVSNDSRFLRQASPISSLLCAPLKARNRVLGVINISSEMPAGYTARDLKLVNTIASQTAAALANARLYEDLRQTFTGTVRSLVETIERMDPGGQGHSRRVANHCMAIAKNLKMPPKDMVDLKLAAILHDIGKIGLPQDLPAHLHRETIIRHVNGGAEILQHITQLKNVIPGVRHHHEHYDGSVLPDGIKRDAIPLSARIIAVADAYDRMTEGRVSQKKLNTHEAVARLMNHAATLFDPLVVKAFIKACEDAGGLVR